MPPVRKNAAAKYIRNAGAAGPAYADGVASPRVSWEQATLNAENSQAAGIQAAIAAKSFSKGVRKAGNTKWQSNATTKGVPRYTQGVQLAEGDYASGVAPFFQVIESLTLPPRFPKGDRRNIARVEAVANALHQKKLQG